ncbi:hypothetical protein DCAR_0727530 [Daucus carota subsp. sativus]|uniref:Uncharacterized protein n=1 Tax=Daucus carota subsp. sativus TaxID=79200 RepID=A0A161Y3W4_DAUCS|nr:PREDICTED: transcription factor HBP-1b(c38)-like [Daucus carota subsp. sativus]WOH08093.1 hypothetical protein DCAR_0727530 [Daucus carota subsp. sativus]
MAGGSSSSSSSSSNPRASFETFFEGWLVRQEHFLEELQSVVETCEESRHEDLEELSDRVLSHYKQYYEEKSRMCSRNVFLVFNPTWFTPFERTFFWIAGFKPDLALRVVSVAAGDLTPEQNQSIEKLKKEMRVVEKELSAELARVQESVAAPELMVVGGRAPVDGEIGNIDGVLEEIRADMVAVLSNADVLRTRTAERLVGILNPVQKVKFLAAATQLQLRVRTVGLQRETRNRARN